MGGLLQTNPPGVAAKQQIGGKGIDMASFFKSGCLLQLGHES